MTETVFANQLAMTSMWGWAKAIVSLL